MENNSEFAVHMLNEQGKTKARQIQGAFDSLLNQLKEICDDGRNLALTKTKLEEACFFAKKSMATNLSNQEQ